MKAGCEGQAIRFIGHQWLCAVHYRFWQMRTAAKRRGKSVPSEDELHRLVRNPFVCQDCEVPMGWTQALGAERARTVSLQHYRDGTIGLVCHSCNTRHTFMPGDSYREMPKDHKRCPSCETVKPQTEFGPDSSKRGPIKIKSYCRECSRRLARVWIARRIQGAST